MNAMWPLVIFGIILDQMIKLSIVSVLSVGKVIAIVPGFSLYLVMNRGVALSLFASLSGSYAFLLNGVIVFFNWMLIELLSVSDDSQPLYRYSLQLIIAGGFSNLIDRLCYGAVIDYIFLHLAGWQWPAIFNLADVMITFGCVMMMLSASSVSRRLSGRLHSA